MLWFPPVYGSVLYVEWSLHTIENTRGDAVDGYAEKNLVSGRALVDKNNTFAPPFDASTSRIAFRVDATVCYWSCFVYSLFNCI